MCTVTGNYKFKTHNMSYILFPLFVIVDCCLLNSALEVNHRRGPSLCKSTMKGTSNFIFIVFFLNLNYPLSFACCLTWSMALFLTRHWTVQHRDINWLGWEPPEPILCPGILLVDGFEMGFNWKRASTILLFYRKWSIILISY